jgi:glycosyltransferase involved in cell wall biosynthesis
MRLILISHSTTAHLFGGVETHVDAVAKAAAELGHEVAVVTTAHPQGLPEDVRNGIRTVHLAGTRPGVNSRAWWNESVTAVRRLQDSGFGDVLLSFSTAGYGVAAAKAPIPHFVFSFGKTISHLVSEWHDWRGFKGLAAYPKRALSLFYHAGVERCLWNRVDGVIATYDELYQDLLRQGLRAILSYNGSDPRLFRPDKTLRETTRKALGISAEAQVLLMVATVNRQKGIWVGIEAARRLSRSRENLHLVIVGDGPARPYLEAEVRGGPFSMRVHFVGAVALQTTPAYFAASDLFLYPTFRAEGLPNAIVQAMAAGLPVVASDRGGIRSAVRHGDTGLLLPDPTPEALEEAVTGLFADPGGMVDMGCRAREKACAVFDMRVVVERLLKDLKLGAVTGHES